jgi:heme A synthase
VASLTTRESIAAANPQPRRLRHASFGLVILLVIQYILGLANNLYGTTPTATRDISEFSSPLLAVHVINGTLLILAAIWLVVAAVRARIRLAIITSGIGLLSVLAAFYGGESFIHKGGASGYSMLMGVMMAVALLCYVVNVWAFGGRGSE